MSTQENKDIVLRQWYQELWNKWNVGAADDLLTSDYLLHLSGSPTPMDRDATKQVVTMFRSAFPDLRHTVDEMIAEENTIATRWTVWGTHRGEFQGIAPTGKRISVSGTTVHHMANGRIAETWLTVDNLHLLQQLGAVPQPGQAQG
jgi:steroid delta-isomerase-like uncharacterized protein